MNNAFDNPIEVAELVKKQFSSLYDIEKPYTISLLKYSENLTFLIDSGNEKKIFRVNRPDYHTFAELNSEVVWMDMIRKNTNLIVPEVFAGTNKNLIQNIVSEKTGMTYYCSLFSFMSGAIVKNIRGKELLRKMFEIGKITAKLHIFSIKNINNLDRFEWNYESLFGENARWGDWRKYKGLTEDNILLIENVLEIIKIRLENFGKSIEKYGIIHSDLHLSNIITKGDALKVIDFDDCGYGWYMYDLGCTLVDYNDGLKELISAWIRGYEKIRKLSYHEKKEIPTFILMRRILRLAWLESHADSDTARLVDNKYLTKTIQLCTKYLSTYE